MISIVHRISLKPGASSEDFENWVRNTDYATCPDLPSVRFFCVNRTPTPGQYFEIIHVESQEAFDRDMQTAAFRSLVEAFDKMARVDEEILGHRVGSGYGYEH